MKRNWPSCVAEAIVTAMILAVRQGTAVGHLRASSIPDHKNVLLTAGWDNVIKFWDLRQKEAMPEEIAGPHICGEGIDARGNDIS